MLNSLGDGSDSDKMGHGSSNNGHSSNLERGSCYDRHKLGNMECGSFDDGHGLGNLVYGSSNDGHCLGNLGHKLCGVRYGSGTSSVAHPIVDTTWKTLSMTFLTQAWFSNLGAVVEATWINKLLHFSR